MNEKYKIDCILSFRDYTQNLTVSEIMSLYDIDDRHYAETKLLKAFADPLGWFASLDSKNRIKVVDKIGENVY